MNKTLDLIETHLGINPKLLTKLMPNKDIDEENLLKLFDFEGPTIKAIIPIDKTKYKSNLTIYSEVMRDYFSDYKIYVLTKVKVRSRLSYFLPTFKKEQKNYLNTFSPSFLLKKDKVKLLINFTKDKDLEIRELKDINENEFIIDKMKYKKKNEIKLK